MEEKIVELLFRRDGPDLVFVEAEINGRSIPFGEWSSQDGYQVLSVRAHVLDLPHPHVNGELAGKHIDTCANCSRDLRDPIHSTAALKAVWNWPAP